MRLAESWAGPESDLWCLFGLTILLAQGGEPAKFHASPVALGVSGPGMTRLQAQDRVDNAKQAVESCVKMLKRLG